MNVYLRLLLAILTLSFFSDETFARQCRSVKERISMGNITIDSDRELGKVRLKQVLRNKSQLDPSDYELVGVRLAAKSYDGNVRLTLDVGKEVADVAYLDGYGRDFDSNKSETYYRYKLINETGSSRGKWQLNFDDGLVKIRSITFVLRPLNCGSGDGNDGGVVSGSLSCKWNGKNYQPYNQRRGLFIGSIGRGYSYVDDCRRAIRRSNGGAVCSWNGKGYSPYSINTATVIGKHNFGFNSFAGCDQAVRGVSNGLLCNWNGKGYSMYQVKNSIQVGKRDFGYNQLIGCLDMIRSATNGFVCNWNGKNHQPYDILTNLHIGQRDFGFSNASGCNQAVEGAYRGRVCNWDGKGYSAYNRPNFMTSQGRFRTLKSCIRN